MFPVSTSGRRAELQSSLIHFAIKSSRPLTIPPVYSRTFGLREVLVDCWVGIVVLSGFELK